MDASASEEIESMSTTSSPSNTPMIKANTDLYIALYRAKSTSKKDRLKNLLTLGKKKPIRYTQILAILTSEAEVREFWKGYIRDIEQRERSEVEICYPDGSPRMKLNDDTGLFDQVAKGTRIVDKARKTLMDIWVQRVKYVDSKTLEML